jgi:hypothetical protein
MNTLKLNYTCIYVCLCVCVCGCVGVCVCERERERVSVCMRVHECYHVGRHCVHTSGKWQPQGVTRMVVGKGVVWVLTVLLQLFAKFPRKRSLRFLFSLGRFYKKFRR